MFTLNADGRAAAYVVRVAPGNVQTIDSVFTEQGGRIVAKPIDLGPATDQVFDPIWNWHTERRSGPSGWKGRPLATARVSRSQFSSSFASCLRPTAVSRRSRAGVAGQMFLSTRFTELAYLG